MLDVTATTLVGSAVSMKSTTTTATRAKEASNATAAAHRVCCRSRTLSLSEALGSLPLMTVMPAPLLMLPLLLLLLRLADC